MSLTDLLHVETEHHLVEDLTTTHANHPTIETD